MIDLVEYVGLRLARRFVFTERFLVKYGRFVPYYRVNTNQVDGLAIAEMYGRLLEKAGWRGRPRMTLEVGSGATNAVGYALAAHPITSPDGGVTLFDPYAVLLQDVDRVARQSLPPELLARVQRVTSLDGVADASVDLVLSSSVLEHLRDPAALFQELARVLAPGGVMLHCVDYRDHFFKYPFHFLLFSKATWDRWLDPGDLPRWRLRDHLTALRDAGFEVRVLDARRLPEDYARVCSRVSPEFDRSDPDLDVAQAVLFARRSAPST